MTLKVTKQSKSKGRYDLQVQVQAKGEKKKVEKRKAHPYGSSLILQLLMSNFPIERIRYESVLHLNITKD